MAAQQNQHVDPVGEAATKRQNLQPLEQELAIVTQRVSPGTIHRPEQAAPGEILKLQRAVGNRTVSGLIQAKIKVGPVGDQYEQEADRVADHVMRTPAPDSTSSVQRQAAPEEEELQMKPLATTATPVMQRQAAPEEEELQMKPLATSATPVMQRQEVPEEEELQMKPLATTATPIVQRQEVPEEEELQAKPLEATNTPAVQRQEVPEEEELQLKPLATMNTPVVQRQEMPEEEEEELQMKPLAASPVIQRKSGGGFEASDDVERQLHLLRGNGNPLPAGLRTDMEARFGVDFDAVRVHADGEAGRLNRNLRARAFTHGTDIYLGSSEPDFDTSEGKRLLAHELTHVVQQTGAGKPSGPTTAKAGQSRTGNTVQRFWGKKKNPYKLADAPTDPDEYMEYLKNNPDKLSDKERELTGIGPSVSKDPEGYVKFLARNQKRLMSKKEQALFPLLVSQSKLPQTESTSKKETTSEVDPFHDPMHPTMSPLVNKRPPDNPTPAPPSKWSRFKGKFSTGMKSRLLPDIGVPSALRQRNTGTTGGLLQGPGVGTRPTLNARPQSEGGRNWKQQFDEPEEKKGDSNVDKMIEKLKAQLEMLEKLKGGD